MCHAAGRGRLSPVKIRPQLRPPAGQDPSPYSTKDLPSVKDFLKP